MTACHLPWAIVDFMWIYYTNYKYIDIGIAKSNTQFKGHIFLQANNTETLLMTIEPDWFSNFYFHSQLYKLGITFYSYSC